jgi:hypothetical protein
MQFSAQKKNQYWSERYRKLTEEATRKRYGNGSLQYAMQTNFLAIAFYVSDRFLEAAVALVIGGPSDIRSINGSRSTSDPITWNVVLLGVAFFVLRRRILVWFGAPISE